MRNKAAGFQAQLFTCFKLSVALRQMGFRAHVGPYSKSTWPQDAYRPSEEHLSLKLYELLLEACAL